MHIVYFTILMPFFSFLCSGLFGSGFVSNTLNKKFSHCIAIFCMCISSIFSILVFYEVSNGSIYYENIYTWCRINNVDFNIGFLVDSLSALMMVIITIVSCLVHIYSVTYMKDDPSYQRFFSYISFFTFSMLLLVTANNIFQLFLGWELVGLASYLLIGFWYERSAATSASLKAFLINRFGDISLIFGISLIFLYFNEVDYISIFNHLKRNGVPDIHVSAIGIQLISLICISLFVGAMAKSAQFPLHAWLPNSMEGPTPVSALIHAATMVTAGIFMVARLSPLFEYSDAALSLMLLTGSIGALFLGLLAIVQYDIKRVIAFSTLSQLGYMTIALGCSAYSVAIFHLLTHAFFKALLFLCAGSVIIGTHHNQDLRQMIGLYKRMPLTWFTFLIGTLSIVGTPFFSGFYSKEHIINAAKHTHIFGGSIAYYSAILGVLITSIYSFRLFFLTFHQKKQYSSGQNHIQNTLTSESGYLIIIPLILLCIPSFSLGFCTESILFKDFFSGIISVLPHHKAMYFLCEEWEGYKRFSLSSIHHLQFFLTLFGFIITWLIYIFRPKYSIFIRSKLRTFRLILKQNDLIDEIYEKYIPKYIKKFAYILRKFDQNFIDKICVNGSAKLIMKISKLLKQNQQCCSIYFYLFLMTLGMITLFSLTFIMIKLI